jgi:LacI family transcriptional regulator
MVSIQDVARQAGTSFKTVSRVINDDPAVREETRGKVLKAIEELGYRPNSAARTMRSQRSGVIGFISDRVTIQPPAGDILRGAQQVADQYGKVLMTVNIDKESHYRQRALDMLLERRVEGLLYASDYHREVDVPEEMRSVPSVLANCFSSRVSLPTLIPDEEGATRQATQLLLDQGHRCIAYIGLNPQSVAAPLRLSGFLKAMADAGVSVEEHLYTMPGVAGHPDGEEVSLVEEAMGKFVALDSVPTAVVCAQDSIAMNVYLFLARHGLSVGEDMAVVSIDNQRPICTFLSPGLTTLEIPHHEMGVQAMLRILERTGDTDVILVPFSLINRESHYSSLVEV